MNDSKNRFGYLEFRRSGLQGRTEFRTAGAYAERKRIRCAVWVAGIPTAFVATFGSGKPVIGILAEYDALPGLSQIATPEKKQYRERLAATAVDTIYSDCKCSCRH
jgi:hypothetical protein